MSTDIPQRLAAVLAADIAGYTRLMERDEAGVVAAWRRARDEIIDPTVTQHRGRVVKLTGDGFLAEFSTAESAVKAALAMQRAFAAMFAHGPVESRVAFRMGVNLGDVWVDAADIYGAGVNVAARLEALAEPGSLCISGSVYDAIKHKIAARYEDLGQKTVKNVAEPIRVWRVQVPVAAAEIQPESAPRARRGVGGYAVTAALAAAVAAGAYWLVSRDPDARWLAEEAIPAIEAHLAEADWESAYKVAKEAEARVPDSPEIAELWTRISWRVTIPSDPPGATVFRQAYDTAGDDWEELGRTPLENIRIPYGLSRLRFELPGYRPLVRALGGAHLNWQELDAARSNPDQLLVGPESFKLDTEATLSEGDVRVSGWRFAGGSEVLPLRDFFLGRYEVTNAEYKKFIDAGGYERWSLWDPVVVDGATVPFEEAARLFTDRTGRPGPSTWEGSDYRPGEGELPVGGVSWYEARAYARFSSRELPTAHHWQHALANSMFPWLLPASNFAGTGPRAVTASRAMSHVGAFDMAGNVREWTATAIGDERVILGGSWNDPYYIAGVGDTSTSPLDRSPGNGIRLALTADEPAVAAAVAAPLAARSTAAAAIAKEPVTDDVYAAYSRVFDYDRGPLNAVVESTHATHAWTRERVTFDAAYGAERMLALLYLPAGSAPPYQTVVYWPGWDTFGLDDPDEYFSKQIDFIVKSGRAVAFPIYKGIFERRVGNVRVRAPFDTAAYRDNTIDAVKDLRRTVDYLETRREIDSNALAYFGYSWGGVTGPTALAQEPRLRAAVIDIGLLPSMASTPEVDPVNALPRVRVPTLMLSGEFDAMVPVRDARRYFDLIGVPTADKHHVIVIGGHFIPRDVLIRETLDWLDRYLGPTSR